MSGFFDPRLSDLLPYAPGEQLRGGAVSKLNTNENPFPPSPLVLQAVEREAKQLQLYPDPTCSAVVEPLAKLFGLAPANVFVGNGSDEILAFCFQGFCPNGAAFSDLTYGFYSVYCQLYGVDAKIIPLQKDFTLKVQDYIALRRTIFIANPNAPTGIALLQKEIETILRGNPDSLVVIDEAYVDFGAQSVLPLLRIYDNLLIVGTFSKSRQLAGARLGYAVGSCALIAELNRIKFSFNPYSVNRMTLAAGAGALADLAYFETCIASVIQTREHSKKQLQKLGFVCTDSSANFLFVSHPDICAQTLYQKLRECGILVRWFDKPRILNFLRISVGSNEQMDALMQAFVQILGDTDCCEQETKQKG